MKIIIFIFIFGFSFGYSGYYQLWDDQYSYIAFECFYTLKKLMKKFSFIKVNLDSKIIVKKSWKRVHS